MQGIVIPSPTPRNFPSQDFEMEKNSQVSPLILSDWNESIIIWDHLLKSRPYPW